ncbi:Dna2-domain-containing protein, partial [Mytilinidion resinicola]
MSTRQKSFFDQDQKPKNRPRPQWSRTRSANDASRANTHKPDAMTGPPIDASTQSRTKLKKYQFIEGAPVVPPMEIENGDEDKENQRDDAGAEEIDAVTKSQGDAVEKTTETPRLPHSRTCPPSTPATRLPLADLVGNSDDISKHATARNNSPDEQLYWRNLQSPSSSSTVTPAPHKRGSKKRARSSSPPLSQTEPLAFFPANDPLDMQGMEQLLKTPQADPAADLWSRYTVNTGNNKGTPTANKGIAFANLINESSPHSSATAGSVSGLRRWASCGVEWPTSATKRRRIKGAFKEDKTGAEDVSEMRSTDGPLHGKSKLSKVGLLVERIQKTMAKSPRHNTSSMPSSSSPLPDSGDFQAYPSASPLQRMAVGRREMVEVASKPADSPGRAQSPREPHEDTAFEQPKPPSSSEYGDEEIDLDMVEAIEMASFVGQSNQQMAPNVTTSFEVAQQLHSPHLPAVSEPTKEEVFDSDDEFGLEDDDVFAADIENVVSLYDKRPDLTPTMPQATEENVLDDHAAPPGKPPAITINNASDDEFGGDDFDEEQLAAAEAMATQALTGNLASQNPSQRNKPTIQRYLVIKVDESQYNSPKGLLLPERILTVEEEKTKLKSKVVLRQSWLGTPCTTETFVHIIGDFSLDGQCVVDDDNNMLILHPDHLISATSVGDSFHCTRKAILQERVKATTRANAPLLYGTILHELFQEAFKANRWDTVWLFECIRKILPRQFESILDIGESVESVTAHIRSKLPEVQSWAEIFVRGQPRSDGVIKDGNGSEAIMSINKLLDVEEKGVSPQYGLKGNIDATVQVVVKDRSGERVLTVPLELKSGKTTTSISHQVQTTLYTLLLSDRYDIDIATGILYYLESSVVKRISAVRRDIIHMVMKRNELACYARDRYRLPPMLKKDYACRNCYAQEKCFVYHKLVEDGNGESLDQVAKEKFDQLVHDLTPA